MNRIYLMSGASLNSKPHKQSDKDQLFISNTTVETHRKNLLLKFEVRNVAALVSKATKEEYI